MKIDYLYRLPKFPIIGVIDDWLVTAPSAAVFERRLGKVTLAPDARYNIIDSTGELWDFYSSKNYIVPTMRRKWSKKKIVQTYNQSSNCTQVGEAYSEKSLSAKRFELVFADILALVERSQ